MIIVVILEGKGDSNADYVSIRKFEERSQAEDFVNSKTDLEKKYWTACQIVGEFEKIATYSDYFA